MKLFARQDRDGSLLASLVLSYNHQTLPPSGCLLYKSEMCSSFNFKLAKLVCSKDRNHSHD